MADAIEWTNAGPDQIVWRYPDNRIEWGSQLIVMENQAAIFYRDGKALDTFLAGRHKLTTSSMPSFVGWLQKKNAKKKCSSPSVGERTHYQFRYPSFYQTLRRKQKPNRL